MELKGRTALVTGGARRIGKAIALAFAKEGCQILLHYHKSEKEAAETQAEIRNLGAACDLFCADLSKRGEIESLLQREEKVFSKVSILINSASVFHKTPIEKVSVDEWHEFTATNLVGPFLLSRFVGLKLKDSQREGLIINVTDASVVRPIRNHVAYCVSKAALANLTRSLALEMAPHVRVNSVAPGAILFPPSYTDEEKQKILNQVPLKRTGEPRDVADACVFLGRADYVNGITLAVDGGRT